LAEQRREEILNVQSTGIPKKPAIVKKFVGEVRFENLSDSPELFQ
jgi:hypothetical protein